MAGQGNGDADIQCTAQSEVLGDTPNILFTPQCACPSCVPDRLPADDDAQKHLWLTTEGRRVRFDIDAVDLGAAARELL